MSEWLASENPVSAFMKLPPRPGSRRSRVARLDVEESVLFWRGPALDYRGDWGCRDGEVEDTHSNEIRQPPTHPTSP